METGRGGEGPEIFSVLRKGVPKKETAKNSNLGSLQIFNKL